MTAARDTAKPGVETKALARWASAGRDSIGSIRPARIMPGNVQRAVSN